jgi:hypothetical protein
MTVINQLTVELPDGRLAAVPTTEETVQALMNLHAGLPMETEVFPPSVPENVEVDPNLVAEYMPDEEEEQIDPGEINTDTVMGTLAEAPASQPVGVPAIGQPQPQPQPRPHVDSDGFALPPKAKTVPMNEMGYPIVQRKKSQPQQRQLVADEDGEQI